MCACPIVRKSSRALRSRCCATAQAIPEKTELPGFERRFSEGTGPYTVSHGVPMNATDRNPPFLTDQDWHISGSYDLEKIEEIKLRQKAEIDAIARSELDERCGSPPAERATLALGLPPVLSSYLPITPPHHTSPSLPPHHYLPISPIGRTRAATQDRPVRDEGVHAARVRRALRRLVRPGPSPLAPGP